MTHYTSANFFVDTDNPFENMPKKRKPNRVELSQMVDYLASEKDGEVVYRPIPSKDYNKVKSAETHKPKRERVEEPYIVTTGKPAKRANKAKQFHGYCMIDDTSSVLGDIVKDSSIHTCLAENYKGQRAKYPKRVK